MLRSLVVLPLVLVIACGGSNKPAATASDTTADVPGDHNPCPIEMGIEPDAPTTTTPIKIQLAINEKPGMTYNWTVSGGTIQSGQGTIEIVVAGAPAGKLTATVELGNADKTCPPTASAVVDVK